MESVLLWWVWSWQIKTALRSVSVTVYCNNKHMIHITQITKHTRGVELIWMMKPLLIPQLTVLITECNNSYANNMHKPIRHLILLTLSTVLSYSTRDACSQKHTHSTSFWVYYYFTVPEDITWFASPALCIFRLPKNVVTSHAAPEDIRI